MVGYLRFVLAALVVYSHLNYPSWHVLGIHINQGVYAVFAFYIISGFFTAAIFDRHHGNNQLRNFYIDRCLRIYPLFLATITITGLIGIFHFEPSLKAMAGDYRDAYVWGLAVLQPFNGLFSYMANGDFPYGPFSAFTPVASLALEVKYFTIYPLFKQCKYWLVVLISFSSILLLVKSLGSGSADLIESYSYRFLIGVLPTFLAGYLLYGNIHDSRPIWQRGLIVALVEGLVLIVAIKTLNPVSTKWVGEMALALMTTPFLLLFVLRFKPLRYDSLLGYLSYGVFLVHIPILRYLHFKGESYFEFACGLVIATGIALVLHILFERKVLQLRHRMAKVRAIQLASQ